MKKYLFLLFLLISSVSFAQRQRNYIYVLDCTKSMSGYKGAPNIWKSTKDYLNSDIVRQTPETSIHVIPFQGKNLPSYDFMASEFNWGDMEKTLDSYMNNVTGTNICDAWDMSTRYIDGNKDNYIYLLTDGVDNVKGSAALARKLSDFCGKYKNTRAFYVVLTRNAIDPRIRGVVDVCSNEQFVDASQKLDPFGCFDEDAVIYANTLKLEKIHNVSFSAAGVFPASAVCNDPYFAVSIVGGKIKDGRVPVKITPKQNISAINSKIPQQYAFTFNVKAKGVQIINPTIRVIMTNKPQREFEIISEEQDMGEAAWYDSFLFWGAKEPTMLTVDLKALFNNEAKKDGSKLRIKVSDPDGNKDYTLYFNNEEVKDGIVHFDAKNMPANTILGIVYDSNAKEGKRYLKIVAHEREELECINGGPVEEFEMSLRSEYNVGWNPLKTILMWLLIAVVAALLIWFILLKRIFYPTFSVSSIMISDPYFSNIRLKGVRKVIFSNKRVDQSMASKIFTGTVMSNVNPCWSQPLVMEPSKKKIRVQRNKTYVFDPFAALLNRHTEYVVENTETNEKIKMTIN